MTTRQRIKQRWISHSYAGEPTRDQEIQWLKEQLIEILSSGNEATIGKLEQTVRVLRTFLQLRARGYQPRINYGQDDVPKTVVIDGKGKNLNSDAAE